MCIGSGVCASKVTQIFGIKETEGKKKEKKTDFWRDKGRGGNKRDRENIFSREKRLCVGGLVRVRRPKMIFSRTNDWRGLLRHFRPQPKQLVYRQNKGDLNTFHFINKDVPLHQQRHCALSTNKRILIKKEKRDGQKENSQKNIGKVDLWRPQVGQ